MNYAKDSQYPPRDASHTVHPRFIFLVAVALFSLLFACGESAKPEQDEPAEPAKTASGELREIVVTQKGKQFSPTELTVKVGDSVSFRNDDPFFHNVFSFSETRVFDLGSYPQGESRKVVFDKPGEVEVECAIHENMKLKITVE